MASGILPVNHCILFPSCFVPSIHNQSEKNAIFEHTVLQYVSREEEIDLVAEPFDFDRSGVIALTKIIITNFDFFFPYPQKY